MQILSCEDFPEYDCCTSCHEDVEYSDAYDLCEIYEEGILLARVCCFKYEKLNDKGLEYVRERHRGKSEDLGDQERLPSRKG